MLVHPWFNMVAFYSGLNLNRYLTICMPHGHWLALKADSAKLTCISIALIVSFNLLFKFFVYIWNTPAVIYFMPQIYAMNYNATMPESQLPMQVSTIFIHDHYKDARPYVTFGRCNRSAMCECFRRTKATTPSISPFRFSARVQSFESFIGAAVQFHRVAIQTKLPGPETKRSGWLQ